MPSGDRVSITENDPAPGRGWLKVHAGHFVGPRQRLVKYAPDDGSHEVPVETRDLDLNAEHLKVRIRYAQGDDVFIAFRRAHLSARSLPNGGAEERALVHRDSVLREPMPIGVRARLLSCFSAALLAIAAIALAPVLAGCHPTLPHVDNDELSRTVLHAGFPPLRYRLCYDDELRVVLMLGGCHSGRLPSYDAVEMNRVVHAALPSFHLCYEDGLRRNPATEGRVVVYLLVGPDGSTWNIHDSGSDLPDPLMVICVLHVFEGLVFPIPPRGAVSASLPIIFALGGPQ